jgi:ABC-type dipeptide/oligopeptide/nickel transport system permease component
MSRFLVRRLGWSLLVIWFVVSATFAITYVLPADPVLSILGPHADPGTIEQVRKNLHLDDPVPTQYALFLGRVVHGDLGTSFRLARPVSEVIGNALWPTVQLALAALLLQIVIGVPLGGLAATRRNRPADSLAQVLALLGQSAPTFFLGPLLIYLLAYKTGLFPISGYGEGLLDRLWHLFLPALTLAAGGTALYTRIVRSDLIETLGEDYVRTARAKGLPASRVLLHHALRNALLPLVTLIALDLGTLLGGAVVTEAIFSWPGIGREAVNGILNMDLPVILGIVMFAAIAIVLVNLVVDVVYARLDPRVRLE